MYRRDRRPRRSSAPRRPESACRPAPSRRAPRSSRAGSSSPLPCGRAADRSNRARCRCRGEAPGRLDPTSARRRAATPPPRASRRARGRRAASCGPRALLEVDEEDRDRRGGDAGQARGLAERARARLDQALARLVGKPRDRGIVDLRGQARLLVPALALDFRLLALDVAGVLLARLEAARNLPGEAGIGAGRDGARRDRIALRAPEIPARVVDRGPSRARRASGARRRCPRAGAGGARRGS